MIFNVDVVCCSLISDKSTEEIIVAAATVVNNACCVGIGSAAHNQRRWTARSARQLTTVCPINGAFGSDIETHVVSESQQLDECLPYS